MKKEKKRKKKKEKKRVKLAFIRHNSHQAIALKQAILGYVRCMHLCIYIHSSTVRGRFNKLLI
jgi:hypothetical protein